MGARDGLQAATRIVVVASITAVMLVAVANPGAACEVHTNTIFFDDVVDLDPIGLDVHTFDGAVGVSPVGVVEWRVVAHAPQVPILNSSRHVTLRSRTWGEVPDFDARVQGEFPGFDGRVSRHGGEFFAPLFFLVSWCRFPQVGRTGDVGLTVYANRDDDGSLIAFAMMTERYQRPRGAPDRVTLPDGVTPGQEDALLARFGPPDVFEQPPLASRVGWWLWVWQSWLLVAGGAAMLVMLRVRRRRSRARIQMADPRPTL